MRGTVFMSIALNVERAGEVFDSLTFLLQDTIVEQEEVIEDDCDIIQDGVLGSDSLSKYFASIVRSGAEKKSID